MMISTGFISLAFNFVMSPKCSTSGKCLFDIDIAFLSISLAHTVFIPTFLAAKGNMERYLAGDKAGIFTYDRSRNPTQNALQQKIAALEGAPAALAVASGMALLLCVRP